MAEQYRVLGEKIAQRRQRLMLSQQDVADAIGMSKQTISRIETGKHRPYPRTLRKIAKVLDSDFNEFVVWLTSEENKEKIQETSRDWEREREQRRAEDASEATDAGDRRT